MYGNNVNQNKRHALELYMALGGVPYYLNYVEKGFSATENIQNIFFAKHAPFKDEFNKNVWAHIGYIFMNNDASGQFDSLEGN